jgi:lipoprotein-releasing system permease protein
MKTFSLKLALKYLRGSQNKKSISTMVAISFIGILIGSFSLMLTLAIMNGFEVATYERLQSIHAQLIVRAFGNRINMKSLETVLKDEFPEVQAFSPNVTQQVIIQNPETDDLSTVVALKGFDPHKQRLVNNLEQKISPIHEKTVTLPDIMYANHLLIGEKLATSLGVDIGDTITLLFAPDEPKRKKIQLTQQKAIVGGFFKTGIEEFDAHLMFGTLDFVHELFPDAGVTHVQLKLHPQVNEEELTHKLRKRLQIELYSWKDMYPALVAALKLEKYVMFIILALITLIASMNIISLIFMQINQKRADIAILTAMGMPASSIRSIFIFMGCFIAGCASILGISFALLVCWFLQTYPLITLPDAYFVTHVPAVWHWYMPVMIFTLVMLLSLLAIWIPLRRTEHISITNILRYDA